MQEPIKTLKQRKAENPEKFAFETAPDAAAIRAEEEASVPSLTVTLGGPGDPITRQRNDTDEQIVFRPKSPKLFDLDAIARGDEGEASTSELQVMMALMTHILWVDDAERPGRQRRATLEEIEQSLDWDDVDLMRTLVGTYLGSRLKAGARGND